MKLDKSGKVRKVKISRIPSNRSMVLDKWRIKKKERFLNNINIDYFITFSTPLSQLLAYKYNQTTFCYSKLTPCKLQT